MWNLAVKYDFIWSKWINVVRLKGRNIWDLSNGRDISIWHDTWVRNEPLSNTIRNRSVYEEILNNNARVDDMYDEGKWKWLEKWLDNFPILKLNESVMLVDKKKDVGIWIDKKNTKYLASDSLRLDKLRPGSMGLLGQLLNSLCSLLIGAGYVGDFSVIDNHLGVKGVALRPLPLEVKGQALEGVPADRSGRGRGRGGVGRPSLGSGTTISPSRGWFGAAPDPNGIFGAPIFIVIMAGNTVKEMTTNFGKLDKFEGHDFRRWQKKMHFLLTTLKVVYVLTTPMPELLEDATVEAIITKAKWETDDYICRGHILNGMSDSLFNVYTNVESAKELWDSLESKYMAEDSSSKKFLVSNFNNYKMVDSRPVMEQYKELLRILGQYTQHGLKMDESISISSIIVKLPPSWKDFKHTLKHGKDDLSLVQLGSHLRIEESIRAQDSDKGKGKEVAGPSVNMAEAMVLVPTRNLSYNVGSVVRLVTSRGIAIVVIRRTQMLVVREKGLKTIPKTKVDAIAWWIDSGATTHVCKDRCWFKTYEPVEDGSVLYMGDDHFAPVHGKGSVVLEFSSGKSITLFNVLYVPKLRKNLISGPVLNKCGYKQVYESDKYILSKCGVFVGFGYYNNGMFMLNLNKVPDDSGSVYMSSSTVVNSSLWHARLGHVHYKRMLEMSKDELIPAIDENPDKCTTCMLTKITRQPFKSITRKSVILELIHSDLCDFHATPSLGNKKNNYESTDLIHHHKMVWLIRKKSRDLKELDSNSMASGRLRKRKNLGEKGIDCIFVGYAEHSKAYRFYVIEPNDSTKDIIPNSVESQRDDHSNDVPSEIPEPRKGKRVRKAKSYGSDFQLYLVERSKAIDDEIGSIMENNTWVLSDLPPETIHNLVIHQMDVKTTFLNGDLDEEVYMKQPEGFVMPGNEHKVCKLVKSLYVLKQAPKHSGEGVIICLYVDDMLIFGTDQNQVDKTKKFLSSKFSMKDMRKADVILGIKIKRENKRIVITQSHYIKKILKKFNRKDCSPVSTPIDPVEKLKPNTGKPMDQLEYSRAIGCLMYAMTSTRPDIAYAVEGFSDASWKNHVEDSSSTSGWVFLLGGGAISWASKKQTCITGSTMESEFVALAAAGKEAEWLRNLIHEIPIWPKPIAPISIRCDSAPTMAKAYSQIYNGKSRHLGVRHSMIRELIMNGVISIEFVRSIQKNLADHLTKGLARDLVNKGQGGCAPLRGQEAAPLAGVSLPVDDLLSDIGADVWI
ncbi:zinc finger, CCHC-type containing protein [Tanacetum coccineum]|uniref:Zinc finger, CCHC-type containing protein n=1 Tax=Tanacetum coccineum TaxID=301880 RepID=A0ABQ4XMP4_9ASTR